MKFFSKSISLLAIAAALVLLPRANVLTASASEPVSFHVKYNTIDRDWYFQLGKWDESQKGWPSYYLNEGNMKAKDGDIVVVLANGESQAPAQALTINARLNNLTVVGASAIVKTNGIEDCYVLGDSFVSINGEVTNALVYNKVICSFIDNVGTMTLYNTTTDHTEACLSVGGTVDHLIETAGDRTLREIYSIAAGKLYYNEKGYFNTREEYFSKTPPADKPSKPASSASPSSDTYTVQRGDTLSRIAKKNGLTLKEIVALNPQIKNINLIWAGQQINLR